MLEGEYYTGPARDHSEESGEELPKYNIEGSQGYNAFSIWKLAPMLCDVDRPVSNATAIFRHDCWIPNASSIS